MDRLTERRLPGWVEHMRRGDFERAWQISDALIRERNGSDLADLPRHLQPIWDGRSIDGARVLVRCYHGLGDTLQFVRFLPLLRARARHVTLWVQEPVLPLASSVGGIDCLLPLHDGAPDVECDVDVELMELPHILRATLATIPRDVPYIHVAAARLPPSTDPKVGLVWRAGGWAPHRSIPFTALAPLTSLPVTWYVLQGGEGLDERPPGFGILRGTNSVVELASVLRSVDLLITVDSMPAHLAGALATPVWTLLAAEADWRWLEARDDSPWYPTMRLFRQPRPGDWQTVIARVARALGQWLGERPRPPAADGRIQAAKAIAEANAKT